MFDMLTCLTKRVSFSRLFLVCQNLNETEIPNFI